MRIVIFLVFLFSFVTPSTTFAQSQKGQDMNEPRVRYMANNIDAAVSFYTKQLGFQIKQGPTPNFAILSHAGLELVLSTPFGPGGAAKPMANGQMAEPGGWNRIIINVSDIATEVDRLQKAHVHFRSGILKGPGGSEILLDDPSGNPIELFQAAGG